MSGKDFFLTAVGNIFSR